MIREWYGWEGGLSFCQSKVAEDDGGDMRERTNGCRMSRRRNVGNDFRKARTLVVSEGETGPSRPSSLFHILAGRDCSHFAYGSASSLWGADRVYKAYAACSGT